MTGGAWTVSITRVNNGLIEGALDNVEIPHLGNHPSHQMRITAHYAGFDFNSAQVVPIKRKLPVTQNHALICSYLTA